MLIHKKPRLHFGESFTLRRWNQQIIDIICLKKDWKILIDEFSLVAPYMTSICVGFIEIYETVFFCKKEKKISSYYVAAWLWYDSEHFFWNPLFMHGCAV